VQQQRRRLAGQVVRVLRFVKAELAPNIGLAIEFGSHA
jgi:hypothetical protein